MGARKMAWLQEETGGMSEDMGVLLSAGGDIGVDYQNVDAEVVLHHGEDDTMVPIGGAEWLARQLPSATLYRVPQCSHNGALMALQPSILDAFSMLHTNDGA